MSSMSPAGRWGLVSITPTVERASTLAQELQHWLAAFPGADDVQRAKAQLLLTACSGIQRQLAELAIDARLQAAIQEHIDAFLDRVQAFLG